MVNTNQIKNYMYRVVAGYASYADGRYIVDALNLARHTQMYFTGDADSYDEEYRAIAKQVAEDYEAKRNKK